ncbi:MAG: GNAT family N-acetyltransferase [Acidiferrobacterales bacterium]
MRLSVSESLEQVRPEDWDRVAGCDNPFLSHAFLYALERSGCASGATGWSARHLLLHAADGRLIAAVPLYLKNHSFGEFVFDWAWADAYRRAGLRYYPKLVAAVPFTPVTGPRLLVAPGEDSVANRRTLTDAARDLADDLGASSLHWLFTTADDTVALEAQGMMRRTGYQFHWHNRGYSDFEDFLAGFSSQKRKKIRRERQQLREAGIETVLLSGHDLGPAHWDQFYEFHLATLRKHGAAPFLTPEFFRILGETMHEHLVMVIARRGRDDVAAALNFRGADALYGRYWGGMQDIPGLHFETCYYRAIEFCIAENIARFEGGAQGGHKLARGFLPNMTYSAHWLRHPEFERAVADFLDRERDGLEAHINELNEHSPFKKGDGI